ncbi:hypothetical protein SAMN05216330_12016 [Bradyrhizobium sp. Ghvi]|nr:hypothetical protein SAMN05216330_12016 [Bradyrhizobium sp. Ghvi]
MHFLSAIDPPFDGYRRERTNINVCELFAGQYVVWSQMPRQSCPSPKGAECEPFHKGDISFRVILVACAFS